MEAKNLRKGNRILFQGNEIEVAITDLCNMEYPMDELTKDMYKPIELNEERLKKFGFKYDSKIRTLDKGKLSIHLPSKIYTRGRVYFNSWFIMDFDKLKYVHRLQNLYSAVEFKELEINTTI